jgi:pimeloyl-ACP methyl ester carboxylesterase
LARNSQDVSKHVRQHVLRRRLGLQSNKSSRIYPSLQKAIETRCLTATNFPGNQYLSEAAARELVLRGTKSADNNGGVQFIHDPRLQWPSAQYFTKEQVDGLYHDIQCPTALLLATDGWPFDQDSSQRTLDLLRPTKYRMLPGSHHFHADPDTCDLVAREVIDFISGTDELNSPSSK